VRTNTVREERRAADFCGLRQRERLGDAEIDVFAFHVDLQLVHVDADLLRVGEGGIGVDVIGFVHQCEMERQIFVALLARGERHALQRRPQSPRAWLSG